MTRTIKLDEFLKLYKAEARPVILKDQYCMYFIQNLAKNPTNLKVGNLEEYHLRIAELNFKNLTLLTTTRVLKNFMKVKLEASQLNFRENVLINSEGTIIGFGNASEKFARIGIVLGAPMIGDSIKNFGAITCKPDCNRLMIDEWSLDIEPLFYILVTLNAKYPAMKTFKESSKRFLITCTPKLDDDRKYNFNFNNIDLLLIQQQLEWFEHPQSKFVNQKLVNALIQGTDYKSIFEEKFLPEIYTFCRF